MTDELTEQQRAFLVGLAKLTRETGVIVGACGCCDSPFLFDAKPEMLHEGAGYACAKKSAGAVSWISKTDAYDWEHHSQIIVR